MQISIPEFSLVVLIGASGSGKSTFAKRHFLPTEIISSDFCRGLVSDDENDQAATNDAFDVLHYIAARRLANKRLTVVDATSVQPESRKPLVELARQYHTLPVAIVFNLPERVCLDRNQHRPDRKDMNPNVVRRQRADLRRSLRNLKREGFRRVFVLKSEEHVDAVTIVRERLWTDLRHESGPFDIIGDVHGCFDELVSLLEELGYDIAPQPDALDGLGGYTVTPPEDRKVVFLGDLVDRGPNTPDVLRLVMSMVASGDALCIPGNHDMKLMRKLKGRNVQITHGLAESLEQLERESPEFIERVQVFLDSLISHYVLDGGELVVAHAGMKEDMQGRASGKVRAFALYGETTGETDEFGLPVRYNWAAEYRGQASVVYGHTPVPEAEWLNGTINIDTGCVFGGALTALRYPEKELVSVPAEQTYSEPVRPFLEEEDRAPTLTAQQRLDEMLDISDVLGKRLITTRLIPTVIVREENGIAALEVMSRFAINPKWLIYLPPTMSPTRTSEEPEWLEHPAEAFDYYRSNGVPQVICEEKHMGSRAVVIVCRDEDATRQHFGVVGGGIGVCYTRTGRRFFNDDNLEAEFLARIRATLGTTGFWEEFDTDWVCLDAELMPWSAKAQELLRRQYGAVGAAARAALSEAVAKLETASNNGVQVDELLNSYRSRLDMVSRYVTHIASTAGPWSL